MRMRCVSAGAHRDSSEILPVVEKLDAALTSSARKHPGYEIAVTGLRSNPPNSANMIEKLNPGYH